MTERRGRAAGWGTLAVVAPAAAVGLAAATGWAVAHPPQPAGTLVTAQGSSSGEETGASVGDDDTGSDTTLARLEQRALAERARVIRLRRTLHRINVRTRAIAEAPLPGAYAGGSGAGRAVAPRPPVGAPAPPPPTHTTTGAS